MSEQGPEGASAAEPACRPQAAGAAEPVAQVGAEPSTEPRCANCGVLLAGHYCHHCGQSDREVVRVFGVLLRDFLAEMFSLDSRAVRTLGALCFLPGHLTRAYLAGRRTRYVSPLRLFLFTSLLCIAFAWGVNLIQGRPLVTLNGEGADAAAEPARVQLLLPGLSSGNQAQLQRRLEGSVARIQEDPAGFVDDLLEIIPNSMLLLVPLLALYMRLIYPLVGRYYIEHLIHALHGHAFLFVMILLLLVLESLPDTLAGLAVGRLWSAGEWLISLWVPLYLLLSLKRVYGQGWGMTLWKFLLMGLGYLVLLVLATVFTVLVGVLLS
ncbi:MAG: hypothetical protein CME40_00455 [Haliea sp.]|nr:hypothetical protein [Haliea sp.]|tara:strand:+ start:5473 stop:6444 length:972 start_codon:yes stop_codon:yes gene_type:complete